MYADVESSVRGSKMMYCVVVAIALLLIEVEEC